ncbi:1291_t:CDS:2, partial [Acaulospora morrowiae]
MRTEDNEMYESLFYIMMKPFPDRYDEEIVEPPSEKKTEANFLLEREILIAKEHENQKELLRKSQISERKLHRQKFYEKIDPRDIKPETFWISSLQSTTMCPNVRDILSGIEPESFKDAE